MEGACLYPATRESGVLCDVPRGQTLVGEGSWGQQGDNGRQTVEASEGGDIHWLWDGVKG